MKRILIVLLTAFIVLAGCTSEQDSDVNFVVSDNEGNIAINSEYDEKAVNQTLTDWALGTSYSIEEVKMKDDSTVYIEISDENYAKFEHYDFDDIVVSVVDILEFYDLSGDYILEYSNGDTTELKIGSGEAGDDSNAAPENADNNWENENQQVSINDETVNLIFIHHSVGENWLNAGLNEMLNENDFHVADTYYGWHEMGDRTDTWDWPDWFDDDVMPTVYNELNTMTGYNIISPASGENTIIMFKSCYPNSEVGDSIEDEKQIYLSLLDYFSKHPDKMFVLITPPPMQYISNPEKTRELCSWLVDKDGWRSGYDLNNLFVFDFYNVLTAEDNHHMLVDGQEQNIVADSSNTLHYDSWGDDHPNDEGSYKAAEEFVPLLMYWYEIFSDK